MNMVVKYLDKYKATVNINSFTATGDNNRLLQTANLDLRCLTFSLSTLHINVFPSDRLLK